MLNNEQGGHGVEGFPTFKGQYFGFDFKSVILMNAPIAFTYFFFSSGFCVATTSRVETQGILDFN